MAQTNYTPISLYYSTTASAAPTTGNLVNGELAINITDGKLFYKDNGGVVQTLATKAGVIPSPFTANGVVYASSSSALTTGSALVFDGTNLGIGTSSPSSYGKLAVQTDGGTGTAIASYSPSTTNGAKLRLFDNYSQAGIEGIPVTATASTDLSFVAGGSSKMRLDSSGNLGLGVTPSAWSGWKAYQVGGGALANISSLVTAVGGNWYADGVGDKYYANGAACRLDVNNSGGFQFKIAPSGTAGNNITFTQAMTLDSSGNLLVGTTSTTPSLDTLSIQSGVVFATGYRCHNGTTGTTWANSFNIQWTGSPFLWIDSTNIGQLATVSDYRLKENIALVSSNAINRVMQLNPIQFNRKKVGMFGGSSEVEEGFLAHELQAVIPSSVHGEKDALTEDGGIQPQSLNWSPIVATLVKAIQEQQALIQSLTDRVSQLEAK